MYHEYQDGGKRIGFHHNGSPEEVRKIIEARLAAKAKSQDK